MEQEHTGTMYSVIKAYNERMEGVDLADQMCRFYSCTQIFTQKVFCLLWFLLNICSYTLYECLKSVNLDSM